MHNALTKYYQDADTEHKNYAPWNTLKRIEHISPSRSVRSGTLFPAVQITRFLKPHFSRVSFTASPFFERQSRIFKWEWARKYCRYFQFIMVRFIKKVFPLPLPSSGLVSCCIWDPCLSVRNGQIRVHPVTYRGPLYTDVIACLFACISGQGILKNSIKKIHPVGKAWCTPFPVLHNVHTSWSLV